MIKHRSSFKVLGKSWKFFVLSLQDYESRFDKTSVGMTLSTKKEIYVPDDSLHLEVILHEIAHAFFDETGAHSGDFLGDQMEELACDLIAKHAAEMISIANRVYKAAKKNCDKTPGGPIAVPFGVSVKEKRR